MNSCWLIHRQFFLILFLVVMGDTDLMSQIEESQSSSGILLKLKQDFYNKIDNSISSLDPIQRLSLIQFYEKELDKAFNTIERTDYLEEKLNIANRYWEYRDFDGALSAYEKITTLEPKSRYAAKAFMMRGWIRYGNLRDPKLAIVELEKSAEILEALRNVPVGEVHDYQVNEIAGQVLSTLGDVYFIEGRKDESIKVFEFLLSQHDVIAAAEENLLVNAHSKLARQLLEKGDQTSALKHFEKLDKLVQNSTRLTAGMKISIAMERMRAMSKTMSEKELLQFLEEIWIVHRDNVCVETLRVGNALVLSYYFSKENDIRKKYNSFNQEFQEFQKKLRKEDILKVEHWIVVYRVCQQTLLLEAHHYEKQGQNKKVATVKEELEKTWEEKRNKGVEGDFEVVVPTTFSIQVAEKIMSFRNKFWPDSKDEEKESSKKVDSRTKTKGQG